MPELPEVEFYRRLAETALGRRVASVGVYDARYLRGGLDAETLEEMLAGASFHAARRQGKLLVLDTDSGVRLGLRFGMTGRLLVDGAHGGVDRLLYAPAREQAVWDRFAITFEDGGRLVMHDPRLLGSVSLDPDEATLGPDALTLTAGQLRGALAGSAVAVKARLLDQSKLAGVGNLIADEALWRASIAPARRSASLDGVEVRRLHRHLRRTLAVMLERGGTHLGDLIGHRRPGGRCPRCGVALRRSVIGGRSAWWCPAHQR